MYKWVVFLHILSVFGFLVSHGVSMNMAFALRRERDLERLRALLQLSTTSYTTMYPSLLLIVLTGILAGFQGHWWGKGWIWAALIVLIVVVSAMYPMGSMVYGAAKNAVGLPSMQGGKAVPSGTSKSLEEIDSILKKANPIALAAVGYGGLAVLAFLMVFKPF